MNYQNLLKPMKYSLYDHILFYLALLLTKYLILSNAIILVSRYHRHSSKSSSEATHGASGAARNSFPDAQTQSWQTFLLLSFFCVLSGSALTASLRLPIIMFEALILTFKIKKKVNLMILDSSLPSRRYLYARCSTATHFSVPLLRDTHSSKQHLSHGSLLLSALLHTEYLLSTQYRRVRSAIGSRIQWIPTLTRKLNLIFFIRVYPWLKCQLLRFIIDLKGSTFYVKLP